MTRKELKLKKLVEEKKFIESLKGKNINSKEKAKFRTTDYWKEFRKKKQKQCNNTDPITLRKLPKRFQLHHMNLRTSCYTDLVPDNFVCLCPASHEYLHWLYGYYRKDKNILKRLKKYLDKMVELNDGLDVLDFKKLEKN
jgi:hypothetical protein